MAGVFDFALPAPQVGHDFVDDVLVFEVDEVPGFEAHAAGAHAAGFDDGVEVFFGAGHVGVVFFGGVAVVEELDNLVRVHDRCEVGDPWLDHVVFGGAGCTLGHL